MPETAQELYGKDFLKARRVISLKTSHIFIAHGYKSKIVLKVCKDCWIVLDVCLRVVREGWSIYMKTIIIF